MDKKKLDKIIIVSFSLGVIALIVVVFIYLNKNKGSMFTHPDSAGEVPEENAGQSSYGTFVGAIGGVKFYSLPGGYLFAQSNSSNRPIALVKN